MLFRSQERACHAHELHRDACNKLSYDILALGQTQERGVAQQIKDLKGWYIDRGKRQRHKEFQMDEEWVEVI